MNQNDMDETETEDLFRKAVEFRDLIERWFDSIAPTVPRDRFTHNWSAIKRVKIDCGLLERLV